MDLKSKILLLIVIVLSLMSISLTYYRTVILNDFTLDISLEEPEELEEYQQKNSEEQVLESEN